MEIIIDKTLQDENFWEEMFFIISNAFRVKYIIYKYKIYFNCSNVWNDLNLKTLKNTDNLKIAHDDIKCDNYYDCDNKKYNIINTTIDEIEYKFKWYDKCNLELVYEAYNDKYNDKNNTKNNRHKAQSVFNKIKKNKLKLKDVKFILSKPLEIKNISGYNDDHRGSDHTILKLPFLNKINLPNEFTLHDLVSTYTHLKSHKFENWYEMFVDITLKSTKTKTIIELNFDHGS